MVAMAAGGDGGSGGDGGDGEYADVAVCDKEERGSGCEGEGEEGNSGFRFGCEERHDGT